MSGIVMTLVGIAIGLSSAFVLTRLMASVLFGVTPTDTTTFVAASTRLIVVAVVAY